MTFPILDSGHNSSSRFHQQPLRLGQQRLRLFWRHGKRWCDGVCLNDGVNGMYEDRGREIVTANFQYSKFTFELYSHTDPISEVSIEF